MHENDRAVIGDEFSSAFEELSSEIAEAFKTLNLEDDMRKYSRRKFASSSSKSRISELRRRSR